MQRKIIKKLTATFLAVILALSVFTVVPITAGAAHTEEIPVGEACTSGDFEYEVLDDGTAEITDYYGEATELKIPSELDGYTVTSICDYAFYDCESLKSVTIGNGVTSIGVRAFCYCKSLESVTIGNDVTSIGEGVFKYCTNLASVTIPDSVTSIGWEAFYGCGNLASITIPDSVTNIGTGAFEDCTNLASITIPDSVTEICSDAFENTAWYNNQPDGIVYAGKVAYKYKGKMPENTSLEIKDGTKAIANSAFSYCNNLKSITIPDSVTGIGHSAFSDCTSLASVVIPDGVKSIGHSAFSDCTSLESVTIGNGVTSISNYAFYYCTSLKSITIPNSVTSIDGCAFLWCSSLESVTIPDSVTSIGEWAFRDCRNLESITIPDSVTSISNYAFSDCTNLESVTIGNGVTSIGDSAFHDCTSLESVTIPYSVNYIGNYAFGYYYNDNYDYVKIDNFAIYGHTGTAAEDYANENGFEFVSLGSYDKATGISVTVDSDAELVARKLTDSETAEKAGFALGDGEEAVEIYDISLTKDGVTVQPDGTATVKLPASSENLRVYRLESDGTLTDMNAVYEDGYLVFTTDHFSVYIVARQQSEEMLIGDVNGDTILDVNDVTYLQKYLAHYNDSPIDETDNTQFAIADFNGDGTIDINDVTAIQMKLAGYDN